MNEIICKEVIVSNLARRGDGKIEPIRAVTQVFEKDGTLIFECDPLLSSLTVSDIVEYIYCLLGYPDKVSFMDKDGTAKTGITKSDLTESFIKHISGR